MVVASAFIGQYSHNYFKKEILKFSHMFCESESFLCSDRAE